MPFSIFYWQQAQTNQAVILQALNQGTENPTLSANFASSCNDCPIFMPLAILTTLRLFIRTL
ncbi:MAG TPA: hypothetical protein VN638_01670 [Nitrospiraceae bacterium]|nr:hypothetical protein [Nitrospiraceae bacterium]